MTKPKYEQGELVVVNEQGAFRQLVPYDTQGYILNWQIYDDGTIEYRVDLGQAAGLDCWDWFVETELDYPQVPDGAAQES